MYIIIYNIIIILAINKLASNIIVTVVALVIIHCGNDIIMNKVICNAEHRDSCASFYGIVTPKLK